MDQNRDKVEQQPGAREKNVTKCEEHTMAAEAEASERNSLGWASDEGLVYDSDASSEHAGGPLVGRLARIPRRLREGQVQVPDGRAHAQPPGPDLLGAFAVLPAVDVP